MFFVDFAFGSLYPASVLPWKHLWRLSAPHSRNGGLV